MGVQFQLEQSLSDNNREQADLSAKVADTQQQIQVLDDQIAKLDAQIVSTELSIEEDRAQAAAIARSPLLHAQVIPAFDLRGGQPAGADDLGFRPHGGRCSR